MDNFRTYQLSVKFYQLCQDLNLKGALRNQLDRAASSISLNLAEGRGRSTLKEQKRFFTIAFGSVRECQAILDLALLKNSEAWIELDILAAHLYRLIQKVR